MPGKRLSRDQSPAAQGLDGLGGLAQHGQGLGGRAREQREPEGRLVQVGRERVEQLLADQPLEHGFMTRQVAAHGQGPDPQGPPRQILRKGEG
ncbi:hypothetical protein D3C72_2129640 [compost metagenome]